MRTHAGRWVRPAAASVAGALVLLVVGATAGACANLATLSLSVGLARPGATVIVTGASFAPARTADAPASTVVLHWQTRYGDVLAEAVPDRRGSIATTFTVPQVAAGTYVIVATQQTLRPVAGAPEGQPSPLVDEVGTPALVSFQVVGPGQALVAPLAPQPAAVTTPSDLDSSIWIVLMVTFGSVAVSLFAGGLIAFIYQSRRVAPTAQEAWVPDGW